MELESLTPGEKRKIALNKKNLNKQKITKVTFAKNLYVELPSPKNLIRQKMVINLFCWILTFPKNVHKQKKRSLLVLLNYIPRKLFTFPIILKLIYFNISYKLLCCSYRHTQVIFLINWIIIFEIPTLSDNFLND